jgi:hypothetical protein
MRFSCLLLLSLCASCSTKPKGTYEENLAVCTKEVSRVPKGADTTNLKVAEAQNISEEQIRDCLIGSVGPVFKVKANQGDSISSTPAKGKAMVLFFWWVTPGGPTEFEEADAELFAAMKDLYQQFHHQVDFIGFPFNDSLTSTNYLQQHPLDFPQVLGKDIAAKESFLTQNTYPYTMFINTQGRIVKLRAGSYTKRGLIMEEYSTLIQACLNNTKAQYSRRYGQKELAKHTLPSENQ